ncbi:general odorant-binding protein 72-like [Sitophilus oryzae]|uniref:General odorant-binding protein 72-like n=1 Tax=Sitophilus oryzae TaxID=7048 RepID=A0A6J2XEM1_SITOR|nr:general odorant-binding protein 72-like [Sitophilus oryzae]
MSQFTKYFVFLLCASSTLAMFDESTLSDDMKKMFKILHDICVNQSGASEALINKLKIAEFPEGDKNIKCYVKCLLVQTGAMDLQGNVDVEAAMDAIPDALKDGIRVGAQHCVAKFDHVTDHCQKAYLLVQCLYEVDAEAYMMV